MLQQEALKKRNQDGKELYLSCMKKIETINNDIITNMAKGTNYVNVFYMKEPLLSYTDFFENYYCAPYNKSVMQTLRELYPEFHCYNNHIRYARHDFITPDQKDVHYHEVGVNWEEKQECRCMIL